MNHREETRPPRRDVLQGVIVGVTHKTGIGFPVEAELRYDSTDPYAVSMAFRTPDEVQRTFGRQLLIRGLHGPTGDGDVGVFPRPREDGTSAVMLELRSYSDTALIEVEARDLSLFLAKTRTLVPVGTESSHLDIDELVDALLAGHDN